MSVIKTGKLCKHYRRGSETVYALQNATLAIEAGEFVAIVGPSGSGKTTLMNLLGCLDTPTSGSYRLRGQEVTGLKESGLVRLRQENIGFVFQQFFLLPTLTVEENTELPLLFRDKGKRLTHELLETVGLSHRRKHLPKELSGGEMQRVAIARALINSPAILLADEPTGNLDSKNSLKVIELFRELNSKGLTTIIVTHNREIAAMANRTIAISDGQIEEHALRKTP
ncbi:MAG: putative ABC transporter ATP-binding protein YknY [Firmicutes bacterium]|nr:putative ABC transporter ATP-binding protein YknY [candidate division NPL-UPA2 bacterium]